MSQPTFEKYEEVYLVPIDVLKEWEMNPRDHDDRNLDAIAESIQTYGWTKPVIAQAGTFRVLAGHGAIQAAKRKLGMTAVPTVFREMDELRAAGYTIADNRTTELSKWNFPKLREIMVELDGNGFEIEKTGFTSDDLRRLVEWSPEEGQGGKTKGGDQSSAIKSQFQVLILCRSEQEQTDLLERLIQEGFECRSLIS